MIKKCCSYSTLVIIIVFIILSSTFIITINYKNFNHLKRNITQIKLKDVKNGDLILRCGRSTESYAIYLADSNAEFTHIGIIKIENDTPYVIHAVPHKNNFIKKERLNEFLNPKKASKVAIYRTNFNSTILKNVVMQANTFFEKKYIFDNEYNLQTNTKLYCTELILKSFQNAGIHLNVQTKKLKYVIGNHAIIFPSEFTKKPHFKRVI